MPYWINETCFKEPTSDSELHLAQYNCPKGYYNPLATLFFNSEGTVIKILTSSSSFEYKTINSSAVSYFTTAVFALVWYVFSIFAYGSQMPSGVFLSSIIIGCCVGIIIENLRVNLFNVDDNNISAVPSVIGAACMMSG